MTDKERIARLKNILKHGNLEQQKFAAKLLKEVEDRMKAEAEFDAEKDPRIIEWRAEGRIYET